MTSACLTAPGVGVLRIVQLKFATLPPDKINSTKPQAFGVGKVL